MASISHVAKAGSLMIVRFDDGTETVCYPTPQLSLWLASGGTVSSEPDPGPQPTPTGKWVHPLPGAVFTSGYGYRDLGDFHVGVDLSTSKADRFGPGGNVLAATDMRITISKEYGTGGLEAAGSYVKGHSISGPKYSFSFFHMHPGTLVVSVGQVVTAGTKLGVEGNSGNSFGSHLHFEIWNGHMQGDFFYWGSGTPPNPEPILNENGVYL